MFGLCLRFYSIYPIVSIEVSGVSEVLQEGYKDMSNLETWESFKAGEQVGPEKCDCCGQLYYSGGDQIDYDDGVTEFWCDDCIANDDALPR